MATANDLRKGMAISYNGDVAVVLDSQHRTPGNLRAFVQASLRSLRTGKSADVRFSSTEKIEVVPMTTKGFQAPFRIAVTHSGVRGLILLDQIRSVDKVRLRKRLGALSAKTWGSWRKNGRSLYDRVEMSMSPQG